MSEVLVVPKAMRRNNEFHVTPVNVEALTDPAEDVFERM